MVMYCCPFSVEKTFFFQQISYSFLHNVMDFTFINIHFNIYSFFSCYCVFFAISICYKSNTCIAIISLHIIVEYTKSYLVCTINIKNKFCPRFSISFPYHKPLIAGLTVTYPYHTHLCKHSKTYFTMYFSRKY